MPHTRLSKSQLLDIFRSTMDDAWCPFTRQDDHGNHCALGFLDDRFGHDNYFLPPGLRASALANVNNGSPYPDVPYYPYMEKPKDLLPLDSSSIKARVIRFIEETVPDEAPATNG